jgi:SAM-dependent methyltransferase
MSKIASRFVIHHYRPVKRALLVSLIACWFGWMASTNLCSLQAAAPTARSPTVNTIPYTPTRHDTVRDLLWLSDVGTNDVVYDLGSGDGRIAIAAVRDSGARRAVGIELNPQLVRESQEKATQAGVADRVQFIQGDLFTNDISPASVVVLYLGHTPNLDLRARLLRTLKPGARVVSHKFGMGEWRADKLLDVRTAHLGMYSEVYNEFKTNPEVPDFDETGRPDLHDVLSVWKVPAPVAGVWHGKVRLGAEERELRLTLHQRLSSVTGSFKFLERTNVAEHVMADLWGDHLRCESGAYSASSTWIRFDGHAKGDTLDGVLSVTQGTETKEVKWIGHRDQAEFTGTWEWLGLSNSPVHLSIERRDQGLAVNYVDKSRARPYQSQRGGWIRVNDFYDCGGGFYFTLLLGRMDQGARQMGPDDGWLVGEAVTEDGTLKGTIAFYPYSDRPFSMLHPGQSSPKPALQTGPHDWQPKRVGL